MTSTRLPVMAVRKETFDQDHVAAAIVVDVEKQTNDGRKHPKRLHRARSKRHLTKTSSLKWRYDNPLLIALVICLTYIVFWQMSVGNLFERKVYTAMANNQAGYEVYLRDELRRVSNSEGKYETIEHSKTIFRKKEENEQVNNFVSAIEIHQSLEAK